MSWRPLLARWRDLAVGVGVVGVLAGLWASGRLAGGVAATLFLGAGTVWLGWGTRAAVRQSAAFRVADRQERREAAIRAALLEQLDECRRWLRWAPNRSDQAQSQEILQHRSPDFSRLRSLLHREAVDPQCRDRLLWRINTLMEWVENRSHPTSAGGPTAVPSDAEWSRDWSIQLDQHQEVVCLLLGAARQSGLHELVEAFHANYWVLPLPETWFSRVSWEQGITTHGDPAWPTDAAYSEWSPQSRDDLAARRRQTLDDRFHNEMRGAVGNL